MRSSVYRKRSAGSQRFSTEVALRRQLLLTSNEENIGQVRVITSPSPSENEHTIKLLFTSEDCARRICTVDASILWDIAPDFCKCLVFEGGGMEAEPTDNTLIGEVSSTEQEPTESEEGIQSDPTVEEGDNTRVYPLLI